ncbi:MAG: metal ABC transporter ATP-binding protein [Desulfuromonadaceae bacterium]|nr:metal ABC transporter ATP-binding protein [Desulfuromonadaceae bacterium]
MNPIVILKGVSFSYGGPPVLEEVDLAVEEGEFLGLVGPNGSGKSTLLKILLGLLEPSSGQAEILGGTPAQARGAIGYVPQFAAFPHDFPISAGEVVLQGRLGHVRIFGGYRAKDREIARQALLETYVWDLKDQPIGSLSGGQLQRVLLARALATQPKLLILDEPTASIDPRAEEDIFDLLKKLKSRMTILVVSHDIGFISQYVTRIACLNRRLVCHTTSALTGEMIQQLYGSPVRMIRHTTR